MKQHMKQYLEYSRTSIHIVECVTKRSIINTNSAMTPQGILRKYLSVDRSMSLRLASSIEQIPGQPGLHRRNPVLKNKKTETSRTKQETRRNARQMWARVLALEA